WSLSPPSFPYPLPLRLRGLALRPPARLPRLAALGVVQRDRPTGGTFWAFAVVDEFLYVARLVGVARRHTTVGFGLCTLVVGDFRSEEHTSELQSRFDI